MKNCNSLGVSTRFAVQKFESVVKYVGFYRWRRERVGKKTWVPLVCAVKITVRLFPRNSSPGKVAPAIKVIVWDCVFSALGSQRPFWEL